VNSRCFDLLLHDAHHQCYRSCCYAASNGCFVEWSNGHGDWLGAGPLLRLCGLRYLLSGVVPTPKHCIIWDERCYLPPSRYTKSFFGEQNSKLMLRCCTNSVYKNLGSNWWIDTSILTSILSEHAVIPIFSRPAQLPVSRLRKEALQQNPSPNLLEPQQAMP
jgi:hypothetical protein